MPSKFFAMLLAVGLFNWVVTCCCGALTEMDCEPSSHDHHHDHHHDAQSDPAAEHTCHKNANSYYLPMDWTSHQPASPLDSAFACNLDIPDIGYTFITTQPNGSHANRQSADCLILFERMLI